jgi:hypothetical protein
MTPRTILAATAPLLALAACATGGGGRYSSEVGPDTRPVRVTVTNNYGLPAEIYVVGCGTTQRLGLAFPGLVSRYVVPPALYNCGGLAEFVAQPGGRERPVSAGLEMLGPGDVVDFQITTHLIASYTSVRSGS